MQVIGIDHLAHPGEVLGTRAQRAVRPRPLGFPIDAFVAHTVVVRHTDAMTRAGVFTEAGCTDASLLVPDDLTPAFLDVTRRC